MFATGLLYLIFEESITAQSESKKTIKASLRKGPRVVMGIQVR